MDFRGHQGNIRGTSVGHQRGITRTSGGIRGTSCYSTEVSAKYVSSHYALFEAFHLTLFESEFGDWKRMQIHYAFCSISAFLQWGR